MRPSEAAYAAYDDLRAWPVPVPGADILDGRPVRSSGTAALGNLLVYGPLKNLGHEPHPRCLYDGWGGVGPDLFRFYRLDRHQSKAVVRLHRGLAPTFACSRTARSSSTASARRPPASRVKIADNGEVLVRGAMVLGEYTSGPMPPPSRLARRLFPYRRRWRVFDADGHPEDHRPRQGCRPSRKWRNVCAELHREQAQFFSHIKEAVCFGHDQRDHGRVHQHRSHGGRQLGRAAQSGLFWLYRPAGTDEVYSLIKDCVEKVNAELATEGELSHSQIQRFWCRTGGARPGRRRADPHAQVRAPVSSPRSTRRCSTLYSDKTVGTSKPR